MCTTHIPGQGGEKPSQEVEAALPTRPTRGSLLDLTIREACNTLGSTRLPNAVPVSGPSALLCTIPFRAGCTPTSHSGPPFRLATATCILPVQEVACALWEMTGGTDNELVRRGAEEV